MTEISNIEKTLQLDVSSFTEKKGKFTYLSWSHAWREFIKIHPTATYSIAKNENGVPVFGNESTGYMVYTSVTVDSITHEMWLPVLDFNNKTMLKPLMFDINTAVMRCLTKNLAMFGLGLYIYAGEDIPCERKNNPKEKPLLDIENEKMFQNACAAYKRDGNFDAILLHRELNDEIKKAIKEACDE